MTDSTEEVDHDGKPRKAKPKKAGPTRGKVPTENLRRRIESEIEGV